MKKMQSGELKKEVRFGVILCKVEISFFASLQFLFSAWLPHKHILKHTHLIIHTHKLLA